MDITNNLTWSFSRREKFDTCRRGYYYHYYLSWGGWDDRAPQSSRLAYRLKKIQNVDAYVGTFVHAKISLIVGHLAEGRPADPDAGGLLKQLDWAFDASAAGAWRRSLKDYPVFFDDYYGHGLDAEARDSKKLKAATCLRELIARFARSSGSITTRFSGFMWTAPI